MTISEKDIYASAKIFIKKHGDDAILEAMKKEVLFEKSGDLEAARIWHRIANAIEWMELPPNLSSDSCH